MNFQEILTFLLPSADPLQLLFAGLIGILSLVTVIALKRGAREQTWERKWNGGGQDDLDVEHGSVNEISAAVASPGEKMIEFMPGILLILGLLGTFLGLGHRFEQGLDDSGRSQCRGRHGQCHDQPHGHDGRPGYQV